MSAAEEHHAALGPDGASGESQVARPRVKPLRTKLTREAIFRRHAPPFVDVYTGPGRLSDDELRPAWQTMLARAPDPEDLWVFAYGSLIWKPEVEPDESIRAVLRGYHRRFCLWQWRSRGSPGRPGVMMALEHGGSCVSVAQRYVGTDAAERVWPTWRREMRGAGYVARWVNVRTARGPISALTFTVNRNSVRYARRLSIERAGRAIAKASGSRGPSAEYLLNTLAALEYWNIEDRGLLALEEHVVKALDE